MIDMIATSQQTVIVGLGLTGVSVARYFRRKGIPFSVVDSRENPPHVEDFRSEFPDVHLTSGPIPHDLLVGISTIVISPGISREESFIREALNHGSEVIGDVELFAREVSTPVVAITGSNGKTTVTTLVGKVIQDAGYQVAVGGNIGVPVLDLLDERVDFYVLELSSFQLESTYSLKPAVATILNVSPDHMDRYASLMDYVRAKQRIYFGAKHIITNKQDPLTIPPLSGDTACTTFSLTVPDLKHFGIRDNSELCYGLTTLCLAQDLAIAGRHNVANILAVLAVGNALNLPMDGMLNSVKTFKGLPHRCQVVTRINHVTFINDSKATNVGATVAAIEGLSDSGDIILIAGGDGKGANFEPLKNCLLQHVKALVVIGRDGHQIAELVNQILPVTYANTLDDAVNSAASYAEPGSIVLLSPACASFDMFRGFEDRGQQFVQAVEGLSV